jgi:hypothetical protein
VSIDFDWAVYNSFFDIRFSPSKTTNSFMPDSALLKPMILLGK